MNSTLEATIEVLRDALSMPTAEPNDFIQLAICGERLRRSPESDTVQSAITTLETYEAAIRRYAGEVPEGLSVDLEHAISDLEQYAAQPPLERDSEEGETLLRGFDDILAVGRALHLRGNITEDELTELATKTTNAIEKTLPKLSHLLDYAHWYASTWGVDPDFPELYAFWNTLAKWSSASLAFRHDLARLNRKQHIIERAVAAFESHRHQDPSRTIIDRIRQAIEEWTVATETTHSALSGFMGAFPGRIIGAWTGGIAGVAGWRLPRKQIRQTVEGWLPAIEITRPAHAAAFYSDEFGKDESHIVAKFDGLTLIQEGAALDILAPEGVTLNCVSAITDGGMRLECAALSETLVRISLPDNSETKHIDVVISLDGNELRLPPLKLGDGTHR